MSPKATHASPNPQQTHPLPCARAGESWGRGGGLQNRLARRPAALQMSAQRQQPPPYPSPTGGRGNKQQRPSENCKCFSDGLIFPIPPSTSVCKNRVRRLGGIPYPNGSITRLEQCRVCRTATHAFPKPHNNPHALPKQNRVRGRATHPPKTSEAV
ncbi:hypothetical protein [Kingella potus]|uniref:hypothetical protein n=1 Tax=Kingella potus TaxID=265175 RepID=UPI001FD3303F|nr:hypothetical protein [Kingella potus]UOP00205.1 hypothetical protein LVJ84_09740 [Kingella potus]